LDILTPLGRVSGSEAGGIFRRRFLHGSEPTCEKHRLQIRADCPDRASLCNPTGCSMRAIQAKTTAGSSRYVQSRPPYPLSNRPGRLARSVTKNQNQFGY